MSEKTEQPVSIVWHQVTIVERFSSVLYPLDIGDLLRQIPTIGYVVPELVQAGVLEAGKPIATMGDIELVIGQENKTLGVKGRDVAKTVESFEALRDFYREHLDPSPGLATHYLEFVGEGWAKSKASPIEVCSKFWADYQPLHELGRLLDHDVVNYGVQLCPAYKDPNDPNWFRIHVEPLVASSNSRYRVRWVFRGNDTDQLLKKFAEVDEVLGKIVVKLERR